MFSTQLLCTILQTKKNWQAHNDLLYKNDSSSMVKFTRDAFICVSKFNCGNPGVGAKTQLTVEQSLYDGSDNLAMV